MIIDLLVFLVSNAFMFHIDAFTEPEVQRSRGIVNRCQPPDIVKRPLHISLQHQPDMCREFVMQPAEKGHLQVGTLGILHVDSYEIPIGGCLCNNLPDVAVAGLSIEQ